MKFYRTRPFFILLLICLLCWQSCKEEKKSPSSWKVTSPNGNIQIDILLDQSSGTLQYGVTLAKENATVQILQNSPLGLIREDQDFQKTLTFVSADSHKIDETYSLMSGKQLVNRNVAQEYSLTFKNSNDKLIAVTFRAYDDGMAFRYSFPAKSDSLYTVTNELSGFNFPSEGAVWMQPYDTASMWTPGYEKYYVNGEPMGSVSPNPAGWCFPALYKLNGAWAMLTESNVGGNYFGAHLLNGENAGQYIIQQPDKEEAFGMGDIEAKSTLPWIMPWRVLIVGSDLATVVQSNLVYHVADAQVKEDFSWVKPGRASWSWWSDAASPRDFNALKKFIDLSAEMKWEYSLVDANWNEMKNGNLEQLAAYAQTKNVGLWAWYNSGGAHNKVTEQPRDIMSDKNLRKEEMKKLQAWGIKGIKIDFFQSDKQFIMQQYEEILKDAAAHHIMVNFHGCTIPRGWSRTWPNLLSMESIRGAESYLFASDFPERAPLHNVHAAFTRNVIGPMDYTPVSFSDNKYSHVTTHAHELALSVVFETGILHLSDAVNSYRKIPKEVKDFLKNVPVIWDQTKLISGSPATDVLIARQKDNVWYIAFINGENKEKEIVLPFDFLKSGEYQATVIKDGKDSRSFAFDAKKINTALTDTIKVLPYGGFTVVIK